MGRKVGDMWIAPVEYRRDPTRPSEARIPLGLAMGFESRDDKTRILVLWTRAVENFTDAEQEALGPTYRRLLLERPGYIVRSFEKSMRGTKRPLEALRNFAEANRAALYVSEPQRLEAKAPLFVPAKVKVRDLFQEITAAFLAGARPQDLVTPRRQRFLDEGRQPVQLPDPWMIRRQFNGQDWAVAA